MVKHVVIVGAATGIGRAVARHLASALVLEAGEMRGVKIVDAPPHPTDIDVRGLFEAIELDWVSTPRRPRRRSRGERKSGRMDRWK